VTPGIEPIVAAPSAALPTLVCTKMYACATIVSVSFVAASPDRLQSGKRHCRMPPRYSVGRRHATDCPRCMTETTLDTSARSFAGADGRRKEADGRTDDR